MEWLDIKSVTSGAVGGVVVLFTGWIGVYLNKRFKRWGRLRKLKSKMREAINECRARTIRFKKYDDTELVMPSVGRHWKEVVPDTGPYHNWLIFDEDGHDQRKNSVLGQKFKALIQQTQNIGSNAETDGTPKELRAYADGIILKIDELSPHLFDPFGDPKP